jgi:cytochrome b
MDFKTAETRAGEIPRSDSISTAKRAHGLRRRRSPDRNNEIDEAPRGSRTEAAPPRRRAMTKGKPAMSSTAQRTSIQVWDPLVRYGHWALVVAFAIAYLSGEEESGGPDRLHVWSGYAVGVIVAIRVLWGLVGARYARFSDFTYSPIAALNHLADELRGRAKRYLGHSPAAWYMVAALLVCLTATVGTGLVANSNAGKSPRASVNGLVIAQAHADEHKGRPGRGGGEHDEGGESLVGEVHGALANLTLGLILLHILGVGLSSVAHRENLVGAMFSGRKRSEDER